MEKSFVLLRLMVLSFTLSSFAVPATRTFKSVMGSPLLQNYVKEDAVNMGVNTEESAEMEWGEMEERMLWETTDYPKTGANNRHDPKNPSSP